MEALCKGSISQGLSAYYHPNIGRNRSHYPDHRLCYSLEEAQGGWRRWYHRYALQYAPNTTTYANIRLCPGPKLSSPTEKGLQTAQVPTVIIEDEPGPSAPLNQPQPSTLVRLPGVTPKPAPAPAAPYTFYPGGRPANGAQDGRTQAQVEMNYRRYK